MRRSLTLSRVSGRCCCRTSSPSCLNLGGFQVHRPLCPGSTSTGSTPALQVPATNHVALKTADAWCTSHWACNLETQVPCTPHPVSYGDLSTSGFLIRGGAGSAPWTLRAMAPCVQTLTRVRSSCGQRVALIHPGARGLDLGDPCCWGDRGPTERDCHRVREAAVPGLEGLGASSPTRNLGRGRGQQRTRAGLTCSPRALAHRCGLRGGTQQPPICPGRPGVRRASLSSSPGPAGLRTPSSSVPQRIPGALGLAAWPPFPPGWLHPILTMAPQASRQAALGSIRSYGHHGSQGPVTVAGTPDWKAGLEHKPLVAPGL